MKARFLLPVVLAMLFSTNVLTEERLSVYTVNYPLQYFAERIAGARAEVRFPAPVGSDPAHWMPGREDITAYQAADLVLLNGAGYAKWIDRVSLPRASQVDTSAVFSSAYIHTREGLTHRHGLSGEHSHGSMASITWLDFYQAIAQAQTIMQALSARRPQYRQEFERNFDALRQDLVSLDLAMQKTVAGSPDKLMLASQPVYHYLVRRYELKMEDMHWEADQFPDDSQWQKLRAVTEDFPALWMVWTRSPMGQTADRLKTQEISSLVFDPCAARPLKGDFLSVMQENLSNLQQAYR